MFTCTYIFKHIVSRILFYGSIDFGSFINRRISSKIRVIVVFRRMRLLDFFLCFLLWSLGRRIIRQSCRRTVGGRVMIKKILKSTQRTSNRKVNYVAVYLAVKTPPSIEICDYADGGVLFSCNYVQIKCSSIIIVYDIPQYFSDINGGIFHMASINTLHGK